VNEAAATPLLSTSPFRRPRAVAWALAHAPELAIVLIGVLLRLTLHFNYDPLKSYDALLHWEVVQYIAQHGELPPVDALFEAFHPPLFYVMGALLLRFAHASPEGVQWISILSGFARLSLTWLGLELYVSKRAARIMGLSLAAVLPVSIQMDGTLNAEALSAMLSVAAMLLVPLTFAASAPRRRWWLAAAIGLLLSLQLLAKISAAVNIGMIGLAVALELAFSAKPWRERLKLAMPWSLVLLLPVLLTGWYFGRNVREHGHLFLNSFQLKNQAYAVVETDKLPLLDRRSLGFVFGWDPVIFAVPYWPVAITPQPRFWSVVTVGTFVDYWNFSYSGLDAGMQAPTMVNGRPLTPEVLTASQRSAVGGTLIAAITAIAFAVCCVIAARRREWGQLSLLGTAGLSIAAALHFAITYPIDHLGVIKAAYMQPGIAALYGVFGLASAWSLERRWRWPLFMVMLVSLWLVVAYTMYCRARIQLLPL
jgi:hypothetical protein